MIEEFEEHLRGVFGQAERALPLIGRPASSEQSFAELFGVLDVFVDGKRIFSYREAGHMPEDREILDLIQAQVKQA